MTSEHVSDDDSTDNDDDSTSSHSDEESTVDAEEQLFRDANDDETLFNTLFDLRDRNERLIDQHLENIYQQGPSHPEFEFTYGPDQADQDPTVKCNLCFHFPNNYFKDIVGPYGDNIVQIQQLTNTEITVSEDIIDLAEVPSRFFKITGYPGDADLAFNLLYCCCAALNPSLPHLYAILRPNRRLGPGTINYLTTPRPPRYEAGTPINFPFGPGVNSLTDRALSNLHNFVSHQSKLVTRASQFLWLRPILVIFGIALVYFAMYYFVFA
jgi:hypothetical protein